ncbi:MAG TPA: DNA-deoxyinosine glycosylase [Usitatibacter sp.]|nr:DNA-deoxyinosine glycosylase [Usitatibacter sp.]
MRASSFEPMAAPTAKVLVLGSLPGQESLRRHEYYAHPRNAFWRIVEDLFGIPAKSEYRERIRRLNDAGIALWDVCAAAHRPGSLDGAIRGGSVDANDFATFLGSHPRVTLIAFNGAKAAALFRKHVHLETPRTIILPSTSPANATMAYDAKLKLWSEIRNVCES